MSILWPLWVASAFAAGRVLPAPDSLAWLASVLPQYSSFEYSIVTTRPIARAERQIVDVRAASCTLVVHGRVRSNTSSDVQDSVSLADLASDSVTMIRQDSVVVNLGAAVAFQYDPPFWEIATMETKGSAPVVMHDFARQLTRRLPQFALYVDTREHAEAVAEALRAAIRECRRPTG